MKKLLNIVFAIVAVSTLTISTNVFAQTFINGTVAQVATIDSSKWVTLTNGNGVTCNYVFPATADANTFTALALTAQSSGKQLMVYSTTPCAAGSWGSALGLYVLN